MKLLFAAIAVSLFLTQARATEMVTVNVLTSSNLYNATTSINPSGQYPEQRAVLISPAGGSLATGPQSAELMSQTEFIESAWQWGLDMTTPVWGHNTTIGDYGEDRLALLGAMFALDEYPTQMLADMQGLVKPNFLPLDGQRAYDDAVVSGWSGDRYPGYSFLALGDGTPGGTEILMTNETPEPATWGVMFLGLGLVALAARRGRALI